MKTAIYIEDGVSQLVLTPESEWEKSLIEKLDEKSLQAKIMVGSFYDTRGGWIRQGAYHAGGMYGDREKDDRSLIVRVDDAPPTSGLPPP